ncbi:MAG: DUF2088 domain-containing protein [Spirochaetales bacterium]|nr:DUF2088 domain-containing protein [Spirochaetales bacterium]
MLYANRGSINESLTDAEVIEELDKALEKIGGREKVLVIPPDITRLHSRAGFITEFIWKRLKHRLKAILPATGTHAPMTEDQLKQMFGDIPSSLFKVHDWIKDTITLGVISSEEVSSITGGMTAMSWPCEINRLIINGGYDCIFSIGQVVPHEVAGMANYTKNILIGTGGKKGIDRSHYIAALYGIEKIMGTPENPVRKILDEAGSRFLSDIPIIYILTVISGDGQGNNKVRGIYIGDDRECFTAAAALSHQVNIIHVQRPLSKIVVYLDPREYRSTWLGNKAVYRTRTACAAGAGIIILAPGIESFGENSITDALIRRYGYRGSETIQRLVGEEEPLASNLGVAAHLIHGSTEGRFTVTLCAGKLSKREVERVGYSYAAYESMIRGYDPERLCPAFNRLNNGETIYYIDNPGLGLWKYRA